MTSIKKRMNSQEYQKYLRYNHWEDVKTRYKISKLLKNCYCCDTTRNLQLHHKTYSRLGKEKLTDLIYLCDRCHSFVHQYLIDNKSTNTTLWNVARKVKRKIQGLKKDKHKEKNKEDLTQQEINKVQVSEAKKKYKSYKQSNKWKEKAKEFRSSKYWGECRTCGNKSCLEIHHKTYERLGQEKLTDLVCLCSNCHAAVHELVSLKRQGKPLPEYINQKNKGLTLTNAHIKLKNAITSL